MISEINRQVSRVRQQPTTMAERLRDLILQMMAFEHVGYGHVREVFVAVGGHQSDILAPGDVWVGVSMICRDGSTISVRLYAGTIQSVTATGPSTDDCNPQSADHSESDIA